MKLSAVCLASDRLPRDAKISLDCNGKLNTVSVAESVVSRLLILAEKSRLPESAAAKLEKLSTRIPFLNLFKPLLSGTCKSAACFSSRLNEV